MRLEVEEEGFVDQEAREDLVLRERHGADLKLEEVLPEAQQVLERSLLEGPRLVLLDSFLGSLLGAPQRLLLGAPQRLLLGGLLLVLLVRLVHENNPVPREDPAEFRVLFATAVAEVEVEFLQASQRGVLLVDQLRDVLKRGLLDQRVIAEVQLEHLQILELFQNALADLAHGRVHEVVVIELQAQDPQLIEMLDLRQKVLGDTLERNVVELALSAHAWQEEGMISKSRKREELCLRER